MTSRPFSLSEEDPDSVLGYLRDIGVLPPDETVQSLTRAGEGNMNFTLRVITDHRSFILKQSRPWVARYPQFAAPLDRALREIEFYELAARIPGVAHRMPRLLFSDREERLLVLEDLGPDADYTSVYRGERIPTDVIRALAEFLTSLHNAFATRRPPIDLPNTEMRALNAAHLFVIPFSRSAGPDLDGIQPGLAAIAAPYLDDSHLQETALHLRDHAYLADGPCLVHGDFFPGSVLRSPSGPRVIDPEFGYLGRPEFDVGIFVAHLILSGHSSEVSAAFLDHYEPPPTYRETVALQLSGIEILRRLLGYAQLPLTLTVQAKAQLLHRARALALQPVRRWL